MDSAKKSVNLSQQNFASEVLESPHPVLVDFWADWCAPCRRVGPVVEGIAREFEGRATVAKLNVDDHPQLAAEYGIRSIPALLYFRDGEVVDRVVGVTSAAELRERLEAALEAA